ncbi:MAG: hypothetical protein HYY44_08195 [Deltaproteobacteria bacterium]|nr:hypothetical protein [Deltaproteobacteria bacterium]
MLGCKPAPVRISDGTVRISDTFPASQAENRIEALASFLLLSIKMMRRSLIIGLLLLIPLNALHAGVPELHEVQEMAIRESGYDRFELDQWKRRAKWSAALPRLQVGMDRDIKDVLKLTTRDNVSVTDDQVFVGPDENNFNQDFQQGIGVEVKAVWYLNELLFNQDQIDVSRERRSWIEERTRLLEKVTRLYFAWKKEPRKELREELAGYLDGFTNGWFSEEVRKR